MQGGGLGLGLGLGVRVKARVGLGVEVTGGSDGCRCLCHELCPRVAVDAGTPTSPGQSGLVLLDVVLSYDRATRHSERSEVGGVNTCRGGRGGKKGQEQKQAVYRTNVRADEMKSGR